MPYNRNKAVEYAHIWAYSRNPRYHNFDALGGDCTNFVSQCLYAGCGVMNYTQTFGWYYFTLSNRAPAWTGVEFLHKFLLSNRDSGPYASIQPISRANPGDILQLSYDGRVYAHTAIVVSTGGIPAPENILVAAHTYDADNKPLTSYPYSMSRLIHIEGVRG